jgi:hypothetical protein
MSMEHKAFAFDWSAFEKELLPVLMDALATGDASSLACFVDEHRLQLTDPYEGNSLPEDWRAQNEVGDVQQVRDFAITKYYRVVDDSGVGSNWLRLDAALTAAERLALLGYVVGCEDLQLDPGRMGSYFQRPQDVQQSLESLRGQSIPEMDNYLQLLRRCLANRLGVYVTF